jgi:hypothetical protein
MRGPSSNSHLISIRHICFVHLLNPKFQIRYYKASAALKRGVHALPRQNIAGIPVSNVRYPFSYLLSLFVHQY